MGSARNLYDMPIGEAASKGGKMWAQGFNEVIAEEAACDPAHRLVCSASLPVVGVGALLILSTA